MSRRRYEILLPLRYNDGSTVEPEKFFETQEELVAADCFLRNRSALNRPVNRRDAGFPVLRNGRFTLINSPFGANFYRPTTLPEFQAMPVTNGTLNLTWSTEAGGVYQLQCNSDLSSSNWSNLGSPFTGTGATLNSTDAITNGTQCFYRLVLVR